MRYTIILLDNFQVEEEELALQPQQVVRLVHALEHCEEK